ncbi:MAG TPA: TrkA family potassium uptake protein [Acidimicrobiales bacterium]|nr:TrkA family potassium uptake protein [Acidimicrobiales bacterium]
MRVVVAGAGAVGSFLANDLARGGHDVLLVERSAEAMERQPEGSTVDLLIADACEVDTLHRAGLERADVVVAATGDDEDNLVISLLAKQEFAVPRVIARVNHPKNHWLFTESWGVDIAVSTPHLLSALVEEAVSVGSLVRLLQFDGGHTRLVEVTLAEASPAVGVAIADIGLPRGATVVAVVREGSVVVPHGDTTLGAGDEVLLLVTAGGEDEVRGLLVAEG